MRPIAPPFPNQNSFYCRFFVDVGAYLDERQRRLHEVDFRAECGAEAYGACSFRDSRAGYLINTAALREIASEWRSVLAGVRFFAAITGGEINEEPPLFRAWRITMASMFAPLYLLKRRVNPFMNGHLPATVSGVFKIMLDVPTTIDLMLITCDRSNITTCDSRTIREFADVNLILLNGDFACAGSPALIDEVLQVLFDKVDLGWNTDTQFKSYFPATNEFLTFVYYMSCQYIVGILYQLSTAISMEFAFGELVRRGFYQCVPPKDEARLSAYERRRRLALTSLLGSSDVGDIYAKLSQLVENERVWQVSSSSRLDMNEFLEESRSFSSSAATATPFDIFATHRAYEAKFRRWLRSSQRKIEVAMGETEIFPKEPSMGPSSDVPTKFLAEILEGRQVEPQQPRITEMHSDGRTTCRKN